MTENPARRFLKDVASADDVSTLRQVIEGSPVPLDANFYEKLLWQVSEWGRTADPFVGTGRVAFERLWEDRYRRVDVDHWVTAEARSFLERMLAQGKASAVWSFAKSHQNELSPNVVEALLSAGVLFDIQEKQLREAAYKIGGSVATALGMRRVHLPPKTFRNDFVWRFVDSYREGELSGALHSTPNELLEQIAFTIAGMLDALNQTERLRIDERITVFVNFMEALALHLGQRQPAGDPSRKVAFYLYERLILLYNEPDLQEEFAKALANQGQVELAGQASG